MALLLIRGFSTPSLLAQGEQRLPSYFNIDRDIPFVAQERSLPRIAGNSDKATPANTAPVQRPR